MKNKPVFVCDYCGYPIEEDEVYYALPGGDCVHEDCLFNWAREFREVARCDD